ncbi:Copia protein [Termitomyces sp. T112]|nr:Copia protein [Termitomyces sp. T112]
MYLRLLLLTALWCILEGGGMAGKSIEESKKACLAFYDSKRKEREKRDKAVSKITFTPAGSSVFTLEGDPATIAAYLAMQAPKTATTDAPKAEFAGLGYDTLPAVGFLADAEGLEFDTQIALEEEHGSQCGIGPEMDRNWYKANNASKEDHELILLSQNQTLELFYLDSSATTHISLNQGDFIKLDSIPARQICGVGGTSIAAIGVGTIRVYVSGGTYIELENALYVPKSTVRLLSISRIACDHGMSVTFDDTRVSLTKKISGRPMATRTLVHNRSLYTLNVVTNHAFAVHDPPNIQS